MERKFMWTLELWNGDIMTITAVHCPPLDGPAENYILFTLDEVQEMNVLHATLPEVLLNPDWSIARLQVSARLDHIRNTIISKRTL